MNIVFVSSADFYSILPPENSQLVTAFQLLMTKLQTVFLLITTLFVMILDTGKPLENGFLAQLIDFKSIDSFLS